MQTDKSPIADGTGVDHRARTVIAVVTLTLTTCTWIGVLAVMFLIVPKHEQIYRDMGIALPLAARGVFRLAATPYQQLPFLGMFLVGCVLAMSRRTRMRGIYFLLVFWVLGLAVLAITFISLHLVDLSLQQSLQGGTL